jgi:proteasome accessory factor B
MTTEDSDWKLDPDDQSERLYSLTLALFQTEIGLTKEEIFYAIRGYRLDVEKAGGLGGNLVSLNRKFDRDKEKLREMGVVIEPANGVNPGDSDYRYKISRDIFRWPKDVSLTARQLQLLELAAGVWSQAALSPEATNALTRMRAISDPGESSLAVGLSPKLNTVEPAFSPIRRAIQEKTVIKFKYRKPNGDEQERTVEPWQLVHNDGLWMLLGFDRSRQAARNFLLKRIHSRVTRLDETFEAVSNAEIAAAKKDLADLLQGNVAKIKVKPGTTAAMHFEVTGSEQKLVEVHYYDLQLLAEELMEFGRGVTVVSPSELSDLIESALQTVVKNHA